MLGLPPGFAAPSRTAASAGLVDYVNQATPTHRGGASPILYGLALIWSPPALVELFVVILSAIRGLFDGSQGGLRILQQAPQLIGGW